MAKLALFLHTGMVLRKLKRKLRKRLKRRSVVFLWITSRRKGFVSIQDSLLLSVFYLQGLTNSFVVSISKGLSHSLRDSPFCFRTSPESNRESGYMQPITATHSAVISPTVTAKSRTYHGFLWGRRRFDINGL